MVRLISYLNSGEFQDYYLTQKDDNIKLKINSGVIKAKELLDVSNNSIRGKINIIIKRLNEEIKYFIDFSEDDNTNNSFDINGVNFVDDKDDILSYDKETILYGGISIQNLDSMQDSLIEKIDTLPNKEDFIIKVELCKVSQNDKNDFLETLIEELKEKQREAIKNVSNQEHALKELKNFIVGTERINYTISDIELETEIKKLQSKYTLITNSASIYYLPRVTISSSSESLNVNIVSIIKALSQKSLLIDPYGIISDYDGMNKTELIPSEYVAGLIALPNKSVRGLSIIKEVIFGVNESKSLNSKIKFGNIVGSKIYNACSSIDIDDLVKHCLVSGVTGSGKTSTVKSTLLQLDENGIPFLIIEPAKTEYRDMINKVNRLKIFRLGLNDESSLKINTFEFPNGVHIQMHLDYLKSVFVAAFPMYGPMPYILEQAMYKVYEKYGWDFVSGENIYYNYDKKIERHLLFPKLEDLYNAIDRVTDEVGYSKDTQSDVKGALKVRIGSLINGAKGTVLNVQDFTSIESIINQPTVIELEHIGDNQEKVFLMGMILIKIYEYYISKGEYSNKLTNLLVIEEAHRLLENLSSVNNNEIADMKGKSMELFNEMLSEVRAYGQGVLVSEQIPTKISSDVIKNTNLKIIHRIFSEDDRQILGKSIGLDDEQISELVKLKTGEAIVFHDKLTEPVRTQIIIDENILSSYKHNNILFKEKTYNTYEYILNNKRFLMKSNYLIISFLIRQDKDEFLNSLSKLFENEKLILNMFEIDIELLGNKILLNFMNSLDDGLLFDNLLDRIKIMNDNSNVFDYCISRMKNSCLKLKKPIDDLSKYSTELRILSKYNLIKLNNLNFDFNYLKQSNKNTDSILEKLQINKILDLSVFNEKELAVLCDSIILNIIENNKCK